MSDDQKGITKNKQNDMSDWYSQVILKAEIADYAPVKGCMIIRPYGYAIWQNIVNFLDENIKKLGVENAYFPMFIPESFFKKEAEHAKGFAPEVAWIQNKDDDTKERLALRPTSETIMYDSYARWIRSWRDLPLRINQWCNIIRWEVKDVKMFLRSREFLWQEGHCVYKTEGDCHEETLMYLEEYRKVLENLLAVPVILGKKTEKEKFAGAIRTYTIEGFMPDGKALQLGTSHDLGQGFAKAFNINFVGEDEKEHQPWQNSWGLSTRTIGAMILMHSDDKGLIVPPNVAPIKTVVVPIIFKKNKEEVLEKAKEIATMLDAKLDDREEYSAGWKFNQWEMKGVPIRIEIGPKDVEKGHVVLVRRDTGEKEFIKFGDLKETVKQRLLDIQESLFNKANKHLKSSIIKTEDKKEFYKLLKDKKLVYVDFCGNVDCEEQIKENSGGATSRCVPLDANEPQSKKCINCDKDATVEIYFSKNY
jgi:prolyl-tRNA synthetase